MESFHVASLTDDETVPIEGATMQWIPLRRRLGAQSFGTNAYRAASAGDPVIEAHVESPGQEEMYVVVAGRATFDIDGEKLDTAPGTVVFLPDPTVRRGAVAAEDDTVVLAVGGWPGKAYHPLPWEPIYMAQEAMRLGDWAGAAETLEREAGEHRESPPLRYRLACCLAEAGDSERALEELRAAVDGRPEMLERAREDEHFASLRERDGWPG